MNLNQKIPETVILFTKNVWLVFINAGVVPFSKKDLYLANKSANGYLGMLHGSACYVQKYIE